MQNNTKWNYKSTTFIKICVDVFIIHGDLNQSNSKKNLCIIHDKMDHSKTILLRLVIKNKMVSSFVQLLITLIRLIFMVMEMKHLFSIATKFGQMILILQLGHCCDFFKPWRRRMLMNQGFCFNMNHKMNSFINWFKDVFTICLHWSF